jgi:magnesium-transporting ATPase (P-type)
VLLLHQLHHPLIYVLLATAGITLLLREWLDASVIVGVVVANAVIGYLQESRAERALEALKRLLTPTATVYRAGHKVVLLAEQLVPGDVVFLQGGDKVPADLRLFDVNTLHIDESALTGESVPVAKAAAPLSADLPVGDRTNMAYSSTLVTMGSGLGVVVATGTHTELGAIAGMLHEVAAMSTPLTRRLTHFSHVITLTILLLSGLLVLLGIARGYTLMEMFMAAVALAVSAIPEGLPAILSITLALGAKRMVTRHAITRQLPAVETLGSTTVICTDKTGTLTCNAMTVTVCETAAGRLSVQGTGYTPTGAFLDESSQPASPTSHPVVMDLLRASLLCNDATLVQHQGHWTMEGDPTEGALLVLAHKGIRDAASVQHERPRLAVLPFSSEEQYMATLHQTPDGSNVLYIKGSPEKVLTRCNGVWPEHGILGPEYWEDRANTLASEGLRVLALAMKILPAEQKTLTVADVEQCLFLGLVGMIDPPREDAIRAIQTCQQAGIRVKMLTGDHLETARAIGIQLGLDDGKAITGLEIDAQDDAAFSATAAHTNIFARVSPRHKLRLVQALQGQGEIVAMTGDGVNDAPALKQADIGVAMGRSGTDVAKEAADMVLMDDNFASIEQAVEEGRTVFDNIRKTMLFILPTNAGECVTLLTALALGTLLPILPLHILWINLVTTVALALTLAFEPIESGVMQRPPRSPHARLIDRPLLIRLLLVAVLMAAGTFGLFFSALHAGLPLAAARTTALNALVFFEVSYLFNTRYLTASALQRQGFWGNPMVLWGIGVIILLQMVLTYWSPMNVLFHTAPLPVDLWGQILALAAVLFLLVEGAKALTRAHTR